MNILAIETSSSVAAVSARTREGTRFSSAEITHDPKVGIADLAALALRTLKLRAQDLDRIAVDIGPGGLSAVRAGVSFANALAFAAGKPLFAFTSFEVAAQQGRAFGHAPVVLAIPAAGGHVYLGRVEADGRVLARYGLLPDLSPTIVGGLERMIVMGRHRLHVRAEHDVQVIDSGVDALDPMAVLDLCHDAAPKSAVTTGIADPLNELSSLFND